MAEPSTVKPNGLSAKGREELRVGAQVVFSTVIDAEAKRKAAEILRGSKGSMLEHITIMTGLLKELVERHVALEQRVHELDKKKYKGVAPLAAQNAKLEKRIEEIEGRQYEGVWRAGRTYMRGCEVTHQGTVWHCADTNMDVRPGTSDTWQMKVKTKGQR